MATVNFDVPESVLNDLRLIAQQSSRDPVEVMREALVVYRDQHARTLKQDKLGPSLLDHKPVSLGGIKKPWSSNAELLEDFFDRD